MSEAEEVASIDGRRARRDRNRETVVDAILAIYHEGNITPSLDEIAERSGVSHRSVFRYFEDLDELYQVAIDRHFAAIEPFVEIDESTAEDLDGRVRQYVDHRVQLYERIAPVARATRMRAPTSDLLRDNLARNRSRMRKQARAHFRPDLERLPTPDRDALTNALTTLLTFEAIETMRFDQGLSVTATRRALSVAVLRLLGPATP
ncbi:MAG: TetR/AcrR family transcriptional regulator [Actinomycetota bacterium]